MTRPNTRRSLARSRGFTIIEVMVVLVILGLIGGIVGINLIGAQSTARVKTTRQSMATVKQALTMYYTSNSTYPPTATWLQNIRNTLNAPADDAWGNPFVYYQTEDGKSFKLYSNGEDGIAETEDDILVEPDHE